MELPQSSWRLPLRRWQRDAFDHWNAERPRDALLVATPGAGKTRWATRLAHALLAEQAVRRIVAVVPREHLKRQLAAAMAGAGVHLDWQYRSGAAPAADMHGVVVTYQQLALAPQQLRAIARDALVILDELHHAGDDASWGEALRAACDLARFRIGMSGTPFRSDGAAIPFVRYHRGVSVPFFSYGYTDALGEGVCRPLVFPLQGGYAEWIGAEGEHRTASFETRLSSKRLRSERLRTVLMQEQWLGEVIDRADAKLRDLRHTHCDAGALAIAMNQEHARFVARVVEARTGRVPAIVLSDEDGASRRIAAFARSNDPWIVAVHMVSEGVDIPRLRVGVFASNVNTEMYFRQFCGRFVRAQRGTGSQHAFVYLPDDPRLRELASRITGEVRAHLKNATPELLELQRAYERERTAGESRFAPIAAYLQDERVLDYGPLFNPLALEREEPIADRTPELEPVLLSRTEEKAALRKGVAALVAEVSLRFNVEHRKIHATLNQRFGGPIASATADELRRRRSAILLWLERNRYDGLR